MSVPYIHPEKISKAAFEVVSALFVLTRARKATKYIGSNLVVKASRRHRYYGRARRTELVLTVGAPNYLERLFIKDCKKAGEPFPIKKVQLKMYAKKK